MANEIVMDDETHLLSVELAEAQAQVAGLEGRIAEKDTALRAEQSHWRAALTAWKGNETIDIDYSSGLAAEARLTAALSGEGKVEIPAWDKGLGALRERPEVREQVKKYLLELKDRIHDRQYHASFWKDCRIEECFAIRAALAALEGE